MNIKEAKAECRRWLAYLDRQKEKTKALQQLALDRKSGNITLVEAHQRLSIIDRAPVVYDGAELAKAVKILIGE